MQTYVLWQMYVFVNVYMLIYNNKKQYMYLFTFVFIYVDALAYILETKNNTSSKTSDIR